MKARDAFAAKFGKRKLLTALLAIVAVVLALGAGPAAAVAPVVTVEDATNVEYTTADVEGTVNPEGQPTSWRFQYATQADFSDAQEGPSGSTETSETVSGQLTGLQPGTTYHLRLLAENGDGQSEAVAASTFTTKAVTKPTPGEPQVSAITGHTAHFEATVDPNAPEPNASLSQAAKDAYKTHWWFTCEPGCGFNGPSEGTLEADGDPLNSADSVSAEATGLNANTPYKVFLHAQNAAGEATREAQFPTAAIAPELTVNSVGAYEPGPTSAIIKGSVNPENSEVSDCHFVYGIGAASGNTIPCDPPHPAFDETQEISVVATSGQFKLSFESETTADLPFDASAAAVQAALESLASIGSGNVEVSGGPGGPASVKPYVVVFVEDFSAENLPQIVAENGTTPLAGDVEVRTTEQGGGGFNEKQRITVRARGGGQYKLTFGSETTPDIPVFAEAGEVQAALEALASIGSGNVQVVQETEQNNGFFQTYFVVTFVGELGEQDVPQLTATSGSEPLKGEVAVGTSTNGSLASPVEVSAHLTGLSPNSEYRYKLVATNDGGTEESDEQYFRTLAQPQAEGECANEARRQEQHLFPGECRAFEVVSPADKGGSPVVGEGINIAAAADGNRAFFMSRGGFAGTTGSGTVGFTQYLSRRGSAGWETQAVTPTPAGASIQTFITGTHFGLFDEELHKATLWAFDLPQREDDIADDNNMYRIDLDSKSLETVTNKAGMEGPLAYLDFSEGLGPTWGASADTGVISFPSETKLLPNPEIPDAIELGRGIPSTYEWDHGTLRLAGILPDGHVPAGGSTPPGANRAAHGGGYRATVSSDGSRVLFASPVAGNQQLYMRRNHSNTVWISEPESSGFSGEPEEVTLQWVSPDARKILFTTTSPLVEEDTDGEVDLYLYTDGPNPSGEPNNLELITHGNETVAGAPEMRAVLGASDDASHIYYLTQTAQFMLWDAGEARPVLSQAFFGPGEGAGPADAPGFTRVSSDGRVFAFYKVSVSEGGQNYAMYVFDAVGNTLTCASCARQGPTTGSAPPIPEVNHTSPEVTVQQLRPRFLSADGSKVFFSTTSSLVPEDTNGVMDVYAYDTVTGKQRLVSSGKGDQGEWFVNASASGNDVFFVTNQAVIGRDPDTLADLYDTRIGGGFPEPPPPPTACSGDGCRGPLSSSQSASTPATTSFSGPGNPHHKKGRHGKRHHKKKHHRARHHHHHKRGAHR